MSTLNPPLTFRPAGRAAPAAPATLPQELAPPVLALAPGELHGRHRAAGSRLEVQAGRLWLTEEGDADDHVLEAGQSHVVRGTGRVLAEALGPDVAVLRWFPAGRPGA